MKKLSAGALVVFMLLFIFTSADLLAAEKAKKDVLAKVGAKEVTKSDIEAYAKSTNLSDDVLRGIANHKEWCKKYPIVRALVFNPKSPLGVTLDFVKRLTLKDIEFLSKNRNVPETLRSAGRRLLSLKRQANSR